MRKKPLFLGVTFVLLFFLATPAMAYPDADLNCDSDVDVLDIQVRHAAIGEVRTWST